MQTVSEELIQAAAGGNVAKVEAILKAGAAHVDVVDKMGRSALLVAAVSCQCLLQYCDNYLSCSFRCLYRFTLTLV